MNNLLNDFNINDYSDFDKYYNLLVEKNKVMNLTSITEYNDVYIKHFYDSLLLTKCNNNLDNLIDVGSGAGFPGMVLAINNPNLHITLLEPTKKRANFLTDIKNDFSLNNVNVISERAENHKGIYMYATARAVAPMNVLLELIIPLLEIGGTFYCMKGQNYEEELLKSNNAIDKLNVQIDKIYHFSLPNNQGERVIITFKKMGKPKGIYPRKYPIIMKKPL